MERRGCNTEFGDDRFNGEVVQVMKHAGYEYNRIPTRLDQRGNLHFSRSISGTIYPHFHITVNLSDNHLDVHVVSAKHKVAPNWRGLASELLRLKHSLNGEYPDQSRSQDLRKRITGLLPEPTIFRDPYETLNRDRPKVRNKRRVRHFNPNGYNGPAALPKRAGL